MVNLKDTSARLNLAITSQESKPMDSDWLLAVAMTESLLSIAESLESLKGSRDDAPAHEHRGANVPANPSQTNHPYKPRSNT